MDLEDGFDDLLAEISEPTSPKKPKTEPESLQQAQPGKKNFETSLPLALLPISQTLVITSSSFDKII